MPPRNWDDPIILTTLLHLAVAGVGASWPYTVLVTASTCASVLWHKQREPSGHWLYILDYGLAALWGLTDEYLAYQTSVGLFAVVSALNIGILLKNRAVDRSPDYDCQHSYWHCLSAGKSVIVAWLLRG
jgi:hypothetical protein